MAYIKNTWKDQNVEKPRTYDVIQNVDNSVTLVDNFGLITELGTPVNADNMNHIEDGVAGVAIRLHNLTEIFALNEWVKDGEKLYKSLQDQNQGHATSEVDWWEEVELGIPQEVLDSKADINLGNVTPNIDIVVEYKVNSDSSWYRKYKSGWLEQGGFVQAMSKENLTVNLVKPYKTKDYYISKVNSYSANTGAWNSTTAIWNRTTTSFTCHINSNADVKPSWYACGQGA